MDAIIALFLQTASQVWLTFSHNWPYLIASTVIAVSLKLYLDPDKVSAFLIRYKNAGVVGATAAAVGTPLCSCGTTAVILGMMASMIPWAPIVAFMVASPLSSPEGLIYSAGLFGWPFALAFFAASILLGLLGGMAASILDSHGWLANQTRFSSADRRTSRQSILPDFSRSLSFVGLPLVQNLCCAEATALVAEPCGCDSVAVQQSNTSCTCGAVPVCPVVEPCACGSEPVQQTSSSCVCDTTPVRPEIKPCACSGSASPREKPSVTPQVFLEETFATGKRLLVMFLGFAFIGYFLNGLIPAAWVAALFGQGNVYSIPLAATLGLPLYINSEASLPLVRALIDGGMSQGAAMAFLITGAGTSIGALAGALAIARWRVISLVIGTLWVGAVAAGFLYDIALTMGLF